MSRTATPTEMQRRRAIMLSYPVTVICILIAIVVAASADNPVKYNDPITSLRFRKRLPKRSVAGRFAASRPLAGESEVC